MEGTSSVEGVSARFRFRLVEDFDLASGGGTGGVKAMGVGVTVAGVLVVLGAEEFRGGIEGVSVSVEVAGTGISVGIGVNVGFPKSNAISDSVDFFAGVDDGGTVVVALSNGFPPFLLLLLETLLTLTSVSSVGVLVSVTEDTEFFNPNTTECLFDFGGDFKKRRFLMKVPPPPPLLLFAVVGGVLSLDLAEEELILLTTVVVWVGVVGVGDEALEVEGVDVGVE